MIFCLLICIRFGIVCWKFCVRLSRDVWWCIFILFVIVNCVLRVIGG